MSIPNFVHKLAKEEPIDCLCINELTNDFAHKLYREIKKNNLKPLVL